MPSLLDHIYMLSRINDDEIKVLQDIHYNRNFDDLLESKRVLSRNINRRFDPNITANLHAAVSWYEEYKRKHDIAD